MTARTNLQRAATLAILLLAPSLAFAAGGEVKVSDLLWQGANLALLVGVLVALGRKPIQSFFADRREEIDEKIKNADKLLEDARTRHAQWQGKITELEAELEEIKSTARHRAEEEREHILAGARDTAERIKRDAVAAVDQELRRAQSDLRDEAADLAVDLATQILRENVDDRDSERLVDEFITRVEPNANGSQ